MKLLAFMPDITARNENALRPEPRGATNKEEQGGKNLPRASDEPRPNQWYLVVLAFVCMVSLGLVDNSRGPVFPDLLREFSLSDSVGSLFFVVSSLTSLISNALLIGWMSRIGAHRTVQVFSAVQVAALLIVAFGRGFEFALVGGALIGASLGALGIAVNILVAQGAPSAYRRRLLSALHSMYGSSSLVTPLAVTTLYHLGCGWRQAIGWFAVAPAAVCAATFLGREARASRKNADKESRLSEKGPRRAAIFYAFLLTLYVVAELAISTRLVLFARRDRGFSLEYANLLLSLFFAGLFVGRLGFALARSSWSNARLLSASTLASLVTSILGLVHDPIWLAVTGLSMSVFYPCAMALINDEREAWASYVISWAITAQSIGLIGMHVALGALADAFGLGRALWICPVCLVAVALLLKAKSARDGGVEMFSQGK